MSLQVEKLEKNMAKLTVEVSAEDLEKAMKNAYQKNKSKISIPGFRKGKVPQAMVEKMYGVGVFYEDAANELISQNYPKAAKESGLDIVSQPKISVEQIEKGKTFIFTAEVAVKPEVELGIYKGIEVEKHKIEVTEEEIKEELERVRNQNARTITIEDRGVQSGDITTIDFKGFVDGEAFDGGSANDYNLTIGSGAFIPGFEEQLIGVEIGKETEIHVTFPEEYHVETLKGKPAVFKVTVNRIQVKELPELDDEFAQDVSDFDTLEAYKEDIKANILVKKEKDVRTQKENKVIDVIIENAKMDIPELMIDTQVRQQADDFARRLQQQGLTVEQYFQFTGLTADKMFEQMRPSSLKRIQTRLVLEAVVKAENIEVSEEELTKEIENMAASYKMEVDKLREYMGEDGIQSIKLDLAVQKAVDFVLNEAKEVEIQEKNEAQEKNETQEKKETEQEEA